MADESEQRPEDLEQERLRREVEELASFRRRAEWWSAHYGGVDPERADELVKEAIKHADEMP